MRSALASRYTQLTIRAYSQRDTLHEERTHGRFRNKPSRIMRARRRVSGIFTKWWQSVKQVNELPHPPTIICEGRGLANLLTK